MDRTEPTPPDGADRPILAIVLTPYRSLSQRGFAVVMSVVAGMMLLTGIVFFAMGAWPVVGFLGLDIALVFAAFRLNFRSARAAQEIHLTRAALTVRDITPSGRRTETTFNPYWARLEITRRPEHGIVDLRLASHGLRLAIGGFLPLPERELVAARLQAALAEVRTTPA